jgi:hypothetical protein
MWDELVLHRLVLLTGTHVLGLAIGSEVTRDEQIPSLPLGATATVLFAAAVPVIMAGGRSARRHGCVRGNLGLRVGGWVVYGLALADAAILVALGANEIEPPPERDTYDERYTQPELRRRLKAELLQSNKGGRAGQWSARKSRRRRVPDHHLAFDRPFGPPSIPRSSSPSCSYWGVAT